MTLGTLLAEFIVMRISMAVGAVFIRDTGKLLKAFSVADTFLVTINTLYISMLSFQPEAGFVMIKTGGRLKLNIVVAVSAII